MKKSYKNAFLLSALTFSFLTATGQEVQEENMVRTSPGLVKVAAANNLTVSNARAAMNQHLQLATENDFLIKSQSSDALGFTHVRTQQTFNGIPVAFAKPTIHAKEGVIQSISGEYYDVRDLNTTPSLSKEAAFTKAIQHTGAQAYLWEDEAASKELGYKKPEGELFVLPTFDGDVVTMKLAYKFDIFTISPMGGGDLYIDAQNGEALFFNNRVRHVDNFGHDGRAFAVAKNDAGHTAAERVTAFEEFVSGQAATRYSGSRTIETTLSGGNYTLNDASRKVYTRDANGLAPVGSSLPYITSYSEFTDNDNNWTAAEYDNAAKDNAALDAHWGAMKTYDYWIQEHGRDSYNGAGAQLRSYVHVDNDYDNAFWFLNVMSYGDGSSNGNEGNGFFDALTSLDVAAHEVGHAVTEFTADLAYQRESGGLNEGYSDIWGAAVEHFAKGNGNDLNPDPSIWLIGDEIDRRSGSAALRSMSDPKSLGQPDTYGGTNWINPNCGTPTQSNDYCGVHTNSGVLNKWFYLAVVGGSGTNDVGDVYNVTGIGMTKAAKIAYRGINQYMSANTTFAQARAALIQSAQDLYGADGPEEQAVTNAMYAVNVGDAYVVTGPPTCDATVSAFPYSEGFENTLGQWTQASGDDFNWTLRSGGTPSNNTGPSGAAEGTYYIYVEASDPNFGGKTTILNSPCFNLSGVSSPEASFKYQMTGNSVGTVSLEARLDGATTWSPVWSVSGDQGANWLDAAVDLTAYAGNTIQLRFVGTTNTSWQGDIAIDAFALEGAAAGDTEAPSTPSALVVTGTTTSSVSLSWSPSSDNVGVTGYDVYQGTTNLGEVTGTTANVTGLAEGTTYTFSVRAKDAAGNVSAASNTVNATTDTTATAGCTGGVNTLPYGESFEASFGLWSQGTGDDLNWSRDTSGTPSNNTGPSTGSAGSTYIFVEASGNGTGYPNKRAVLNSPCFDLSGESEATFSFDYHMYGANDFGTLSLEASDDNGVSWTVIWSESGNKGNQWNSASVSLDAYAGASVQLRFDRVTGGTWQADAAIDNAQLVAGGSTGGGTPPSGYCSSNGNNINDEFIQRVQLGSIDNSTGASAGGYGDFTNISTDLSGTNTITITPQWTGTIYSEGYAVFIDYNRDGDFADAGETVFTRAATTATPISGTFTVPSGVSGATRMRVSMKYNGIPTACESFQYGEVEDYIVNLGGGSTATFAGFDTAVEVASASFQSLTTLDVYPTPASTVLHIDLKGAQASSFTVYNVMGQVVLKGAYTEAIDVTRFEAGMYILEVASDEETVTKRFIKK